jgi:hypothetical protein
VPRSSTAGPTQLTDGIPTGYAHNELGAALAAFNISFQLTSDAGPAVYNATAREQTYGAVTETLAEVQSSPPGGSSPATEFFYKVLSGDPTGTRVMLSIAQRTAESAANGGFYVTDRELRWQAGDWRMALPMPGVVLQSGLPGFISLGGPNV